MASIAMDVDVRDEPIPSSAVIRPGQWSHLPAPSSSSGIPTLLIEAAALLVGALGPVVRSRSILPDPQVLPMAAVAIIATLVMGRLGKHQLIRYGVAIAAGIAASTFAGQIMAGWLIAGLLLADWGVRGRRPLTAVPDPEGRAILPLCVIALVAAWQGFRNPPALWPVAMFVIVGLVLTLVASFFGNGMTKLVRTVGHAAAFTVSRITFFVLGLVVVVIPWVVQRLLRIDPLESPKRPGTAWVRRSRRPVRATHPWADSGLVDPLSSWTRLRRAAALPLAAVVLGVAILVNRGGSNPAPSASFTLGKDAGGGTGQTADTTPQRDNPPPPPEKIPGPFIGEEWYPQYFKDVTWIWQDKVAWDPLSMWRIKDVATKSINVRNRERVSWTAPSCGECPRLEVWMYGGSTTFGLGQRDDHTIPSELARVAHEAGIQIDVKNKGIPGDMHWEESQRYAWDIANGGRPDLVVFFDGVNELWGTQRLSNTHEGDRDRPVDPVKEEFWDGWLRTYANSPFSAPDGGKSTTPTTVSDLSAEQTGQLAVTRYDRSRRVSSDLSEANDLPTVWFWQPSRYSRPPVQGEYEGDGGNAWAQRFYDSAQAAVSDDVEDLSNVYDNDPNPYFYDDVHTNEKGARVVAEEMFARLRPQLELLRESKKLQQED